MVGEGWVNEGQKIHYINFFFYKTTFTKIFFFLLISLFYSYPSPTIKLVIRIINIRIIRPFMIGEG